MQLSVGYTSTDVVYKWNTARQAVAIAEDMKLSQFDLVEFPAGKKKLIFTFIAYISPI
jgi:hypothetical protein